MRKDCNEIISTTIRSVENNMTNLYSKGVVEGVKVVKNLIEVDNITDINLLKQALDIFVARYENKDGRVTEGEDIVDVRLSDIISGNNVEIEGDK
jgi:hypothetical protein